MARLKKVNKVVKKEMDVIETLHKVRLASNEKEVVINGKTYIQVTDANGVTFLK